MGASGTCLQVLTASNLIARNIPDVLRETLRRREAGNGDGNKEEQFLLYSSQEGRLLMFCAQTEMRLLHESSYVICDGTFKMCPDTAYQLYTMHGFRCREAMPLVWALGDLFRGGPRAPPPSLDVSIIHFLQMYLKR